MSGATAGKGKDNIVELLNVSARTCLANAIGYHRKSTADCISHWPPEPATVNRMPLNSVSTGLGVATTISVSCALGSVANCHCMWLFEERVLCIAINRPSDARARLVSAHSGRDFRMISVMTVTCRVTSLDAERMASCERTTVCEELCSTSRTPD